MTTDDRGPFTSDEFSRLDAVYWDVWGEAKRARAKHGDQSHVPNGTGRADQVLEAMRKRRECDTAFRDGRGTWRHILAEEVAEAFAEIRPELLRAELIQVAAVAAAWIAAIDKGEQTEAAL